MTAHLPVFVSYPGATPPQTGTHYVVGRNGLWLHLRNDWVDALVRVPEFQALETVAPRASLKLPPIDATVFAQAVAFFRRVYDLYRSEAAVLLFYSKEHGWALNVPAQDVSAAYVKWHDPEAARKAGYRQVGTMHSHGIYPASHSNVDVEDEAAIDGVHITIGDMPIYPHFSLSAELVVRGERFELAHTVLGGVHSLNPSLGVQGLELVLGYFDRQSSFTRRRARYSHNPAILAGWNVPEEWLDKVTPPFGYRKWNLPAEIATETPAETTPTPEPQQSTTNLPVSNTSLPTSNTSDLLPPSPLYKVLRRWQLRGYVWFRKTWRRFQKWKSNTSSS